MIKTLASFGVGFFLARQFYINYNKGEALKKEATIKQNIKEFLEDNGLTASEVKEQVEELVNTKRA